MRKTSRLIVCTILPAVFAYSCDSGRAFSQSDTAVTVSADSHVAIVKPPNINELPLAFNIVKVFAWPSHFEWKSFDPNPSVLALYKSLNLSFGLNSHNFIS